METDLELGPKQRSPPVFKSFSDWARSRASSSRAPPPPKPVVVPWTFTRMPMTSGPLANSSHEPVTDLSLGGVNAISSNPSSSPVNTTSPPPIVQTHREQENPLPQLLINRHCLFTLKLLTPVIQQWRSDVHNQVCSCLVGCMLKRFRTDR